MTERHKWAFWLLVGLLAALILVPSSLLLENIGSYRKFLSGFQPGVLRPTTVRFVAHKDEKRGAPRLEFVDFSLRAPQAGSVELIGDFNGWKAGSLKLVKSSGGAWEITLPLPLGSYHYLFLVDGAERTDPANQETVESGGRVASVLVVR